EPATPTAIPALQTDTIKLRKRDTMVAALLRHDVSSAAAHEITGALRAAGANLRLLQPGDELELARADDGRPVMLAFAPNAWLRFEAIDSDGKWEVARTEIEPEVRIEVRQGEVRHSLWDTVENGDVAPSVLLDLVQIFESEFDFTADTQPGDRFRLLVETRYADGVPVDFGRILAAQYISDGLTLTGVGFAAPGRASDQLAYYDAEGGSLKKMFLRSPLQFTRISSGFTYRRPHPILGGTRPHLAIDYAAPTGTPVWAVADGVVLFAGRNRGNGIQVQLRHRTGYQTYYNHLSRIGRGIRRGVHVGQKQVIGYVGSTGLSTGPHLDYRVKHSGKFVNPLNEKFLPGKKIAAAHRALFLERARALVARLEQEAPSQRSVDRESPSKS
ncbi:MAG: M23 family metallopeptidase, partial [Sulfuritalea sp.]|nr:M23 family metallopeptidase [Sulfuritalea sp.]